MTAANGAEALAQARTRPPALILSDVMMPVMDGYTLLHAVRGIPELQHTLVFLMSAAFAPPQRLQTTPPPDGYMAKPFNLMVVEGLLEHLPLSEACL
jgi:CheY-like chemotaxis protein